LRGGVGTASAVLCRDLFREFHQGRLLADRSALPVHDADCDPFQACRGHSRPGTHATAEPDATQAAAA